MITEYSFGMMTINGKVYRKDLIILPDGSIHHPWWRSSGHIVSIADINFIFSFCPADLVLGTGDPGLMKPDNSLIPKLESKGIQMHILPTRQAIRKFNKLTSLGSPCAAGFHLTC